MRTCTGQVLYRWESVAWGEQRRFAPSEGGTPSLQKARPTGEEFRWCETPMRTDRTEGARSHRPALDWAVGVRFPSGGKLVSWKCTFRRCDWRTKGSRVYTIVADDPPRNAPPKVFDAKLAVQDDMLLVALQDGAVVGTTMAGYDGFRGWLHRVAVSPQHQG